LTLIVVPPTVRQLKDQNYRCPGCRQPLTSARLCYYTGAYYCQNCHKNDKAILPAQILLNWDFAKYKVSVYAKEYLSDIYDKPIIDVTTVNSSLFEYIPQLQKLRDLRRYLSYMSDYINTCRDSDKLLESLEERNHLLLSHHQNAKYSIRDLEETEKGTLLPFLAKIVKEYSDHITTKCELCKAKGFYCDFCKSDQLIYPFQLNSTTRCENCAGLYHKKCYKKETCPKCLRIAKFKPVTK